MALQQYDEERKRMASRFSNAADAQNTAIERKFRQLGDQNTQVAQKTKDVLGENLRRNYENSQNDLNAEEMQVQRQSDEADTARVRKGEDILSQQMFQQGERVADEAFKKQIADKQLQLDKDIYYGNRDYNIQTFFDNLSMEKDVANFNKWVATKLLQDKDEDLRSFVFDFQGRPGGPTIQLPAPGPIGPIGPVGVGAGPGGFGGWSFTY